jgi:RNA polymerase sigma-70 factor (ECF subfamily)
MQMEDAQLVARSLAGDTDAYGALVERYQSAVYATAHYYVGRSEAAEDIAQNAFLAAYKSLRRLKDPSRFAPWLREITCRTAANWLRRHGKRIQNETPLPYRRQVDLEDVREGPSEPLDRNERFERVQNAIEALPERYRLPVALRYLQELSYAEIAEFTGLTYGETRGILQRAAKMLRAALGDEGGQADSQGETPWRRAHE